MGFFPSNPDRVRSELPPGAPNILADEAASRDAVVVASELALSEIVAGRLPFDEALREQIVALDADATRHAALLNAWRNAYPEVGFSRYVCA